MIASVRGVVLSAGLDSAVIEVGGVGLRLHTTAGTAASLRPGAEATLATTLVVREESLTLYGFADEDERAIFNLVQTVSGVGPRLALAMLAIHAPDGLRRAIGGGDLAALTKVPGIGKKGAERIILELRDKIGAPSAAPSSEARRPAVDQAAEQVRDALVGLGWSSRQADDAVEAVRPEAGNGSNGSNGSNVSALLRAALRELAR
ncbi:MAG TPA: Holliday junction branch migration protein RuvA [Dermatophilaceae bacterium]|nr:Holliday junction branch migration protein RuvA [Dermatophilaceae bacterium]